MAQKPSYGPPGPPPFGTLEIHRATALPVHNVVELTLYPRPDEAARGARPIRVHMQRHVAHQIVKVLTAAAQKAVRP